MLNAGSAHRQIARSLGCAPSTVTRLSARLGRHALLLQAHALDTLGEIGEPVALDHLETFVVRQEEALGLACFMHKVRGASEHSPILSSCGSRAGSSSAVDDKWR